ncbi:hypothetical protein [Clostridium fessum]|jgi:hypothetical protein|nr:hypothetical protein [Clostridium fessum]
MKKRQRKEGGLPLIADGKSWAVRGFFCEEHNLKRNFNKEGMINVSEL